MSRPRRRFLNIIFRLGCFLAVVLALALLTAWLLLRASLPPLIGRQKLAALSAAAAIDRDADGVPTIHAANRDDALCALGFLHAQDRFFEMDLLRRQAAGELAELFGPLAVPIDCESRQHAFRQRAAEVLRALTPEQSHLLDAYVAGVNAGLASLGARPWEYFVLRETPRPWSREDSVLVVDALVMTLESDGSDERLRAAVAATYGDDVRAFLCPPLGQSDAAIDGTTSPAPALPGAEQFVPRAIPTGEVAPVPVFTASSETATGNTELPGSNSFALAGARTANGAALVANDPHLRLAVPHIWYRASLAWPQRRVTGATLPGVPAVALGSNGDIAWSFTNSYINTADLVIVETDPAHAGQYRVPDGNGWEALQHTHETIRVHGAAPVSCDVVGTRWGPLVTQPGKNAPVYSRHWLEYDPGSVNFAVADLLDAPSVDAAIAIAQRSGIHPQNFIVGDRAGNAAWTIIGRVPRRVGFDGQVPTSWADGTRRWDGFVPPAEVPVIKNPAAGQLWSANNRIVGGDSLAILGDGGYANPARAAQIRDRLTALTGQAARPADLLAIQLDDEGLYLSRWRPLLLDVLTDSAVAHELLLAQMRDLVRAWNGHASIDSAGYRLLREYRRIVTTMVMNPIFAPVTQRDPVATTPANSEQPLWTILKARPPYLIPAGEPSWDAALLRAARLTAKLGEHQPGGLTLAQCTWGQRNVLAMIHPFSRGLPAWGAQWIDMPAQPLPGDVNMPRVQTPTFGASMRMDVSPGHEDEGIYEQPGGASGHPLSAFYRAGHEDWVAGRPSPFLPGPVKYRLDLQP